MYFSNDDQEIMKVMLAVCFSYIEIFHIFKQETAIIEEWNDDKSTGVKDDKVRT